MRNGPPPVMLVFFLPLLFGTSHCLDTEKERERERELGSKVTLRGVSVACSQFFWVALFLHENVLFLDQISAPFVQRNIFHFFFSFVILFYFSRFPSICNFPRELILIFPFILIFPSFY
jgi:hypothetical protein